MHCLTKGAAPLGVAEDGVGFNAQLDGLRYDVRGVAIYSELHF